MGKPVPDGSLPWTDRSRGVASEVIAIGKRQSGEAEDQTEEAGLDRSIPSRGWGLFLSLLEYKLERKGGRMVRVDPRNTSRTCSACGHVSPENRKTQEAFVCVVCGHAENADANAARNILGAGQARSACSEAKTSESAA